MGARQCIRPFLLTDFSDSAAVAFLPPSSTKAEQAKVDGPFTPFRDSARLIGTALRYQIPASGPSHYAHSRPVYFTQLDPTGPQIFGNFDSLVSLQQYNLSSHNGQGELESLPRCYNQADRSLSQDFYAIL